MPGVVKALQVHCSATNSAKKQPNGDNESGDVRQTPQTRS
jgi:hypothetical protein